MMKYDEFTWFVVAVMTPIGKVKTRAKEIANRTPQ